MKSFSFNNSDHEGRRIIKYHHLIMKSLFFTSLSLPLSIHLLAIIRCAVRCKKKILVHSHKATLIFGSCKIVNTKNGNPDKFFARCFPIVCFVYAETHSHVVSFLQSFANYFPIKKNKSSETLTLRLVPNGVLSQIFSR